MRSRATLAAIAIAVATLGACVDLFHSTDFETLCSRDPANAECVGSGNDAGVDSADAAPAEVDLCTRSGDPAARAKRLCAWLGACEGVRDESRFGGCFVDAVMALDCNANPGLRPRGETARLWACLDDATTCDAVDACLFGGPVPKCNTIASGSFTACAPGGNVRVQCSAPGGGRPAAVEPCLLEGRACTALDSSRAACTGPKKNTCAVGTTGCTGSGATHCVRSGADDLDLGLDCGAFGAGACTGTSSAACSPVASASSCSDTSGALTCAGKVAHVCANKHEITIDCAKLSLDCDATAGNAQVPWSACAITGDAGTCTAADKDTCTGTVLSSCTSGAYASVDCAQVGLGACSVNANGVGTCARP